MCAVCVGEAMIERGLDRKGTATAMARGQAMAAPVIGCPGAAAPADAPGA
jgi:hypothetical protein